MPQPAAQRSRAGDEVAAGTAAAGAVAVAAPPAVTAAAAGSATVAATKTLTASVMAAFVTFLASLRHQHQTWLAQQMTAKGVPLDDLQQVLAREMVLEQAFAKASADRVAAALPHALEISDPEERQAAIRKIFAAEERYAQQRGEAMAARAFAAVARLQLRRDSPAGAFWNLGRAHKHTDGCLAMAGKFWPWVVLDRVHPPRHYGCTSSLEGYDEAVAGGKMTPGDVPDVRDAIRRASGVSMMREEADALLRELDVRDHLRELGVDGSALDAIEMKGAGDGTAEAVPPTV